MWIAKGFFEFGLLYWIPEDHKSQFSKDVVFNFFVTVVCVTPATLINILIIDLPLFGRKKTMMYCSLIAAGMTATCIFIEQKEVALFFMAGAKMSFVASSNALFVYTTEYYPTTIRATSLGVLAATSRATGVLFPLITVYVHNNDW